MSQDSQDLEAAAIETYFESLMSEMREKLRNESSSPQLPPSPSRLASQFRRRSRAHDVRRRLDRVAQVLDQDPEWLSRGSLARLDGALSGFLDVVRAEFRASGSRSVRPGSAPASQTPTSRFFTETKAKTPEQVAERIQKRSERDFRNKQERHD